MALIPAHLDGRLHQMELIARIIWLAPFQDPERPSVPFFRFLKPQAVMIDRRHAQGDFAGDLMAAPIVGHTLPIEPHHIVQRLLKITSDPQHRDERVISAKQPRPQFGPKAKQGKTDGNRLLHLFIGSIPYVFILCPHPVQKYAAVFRNGLEIMAYAFRDNRMQAVITDTVSFSFPDKGHADEFLKNCFL